MSQGQTTINYKDENFEYKTSKASLYVDFSLKFHSGALFLPIAEKKQVLRLYTPLALNCYTFDT